MFRGNVLYFTYIFASVVFICDTTALNCAVTSVCPPERPLCTPVGCVVTCPENSFQNGSECVSDCGDGVVDANKCKDDCPPEKSYIEERIWILGETFQRVRFCLSSCVTHSLVAYNNRCVDVCPEEAKYIFDNKCTALCPDSHVFKYIKDTPVNVTNIICRKSCPSYYRNLTCVPQCLRQEFVIEYECVDMCPNNTYVIHDNKCVTDCPLPFYKLNLTCVWSCPATLFVWNDSCIEKCPEGYDFFWNTSINNRCVNDCGIGYNLGHTCVTKCDDLIANRSCVQTCPTIMPYHLQRSNQWRKEDICVSECPGNMFYHNDKCVQHCPITYLKNRSCIHNCSREHPFLNGDKCLEECPSSSYVLNFSCVPTCPRLSYNHSCLHECPSTTFRMQNKCVDQCPQNMLYYGNHCVIYCMGKTYKYKNQCIAECPPDQPLVEDISSTYNGHRYAECVTTCGDGKLSNGTACIESYKCNKAMIINRQCLDKCPEGTYWIGTSVQYDGTCQPAWIYSIAIIVSLIGIAGLIGVCVKYLGLRTLCCRTPSSSRVREQGESSKIPDSQEDGDVSLLIDDNVDQELTSASTHNLIN